MKRKALFIGVNAYRDPEIRDLGCSVRDANSMHDIFEMLGYEVKLLENPGKVDVFNAIRAATHGLTSGDQFVMYFAGHGFSDSGQHLLFCADDMYRQLRYHRAGMPFDQLEEETRKGGYGRVFLLDACQSDFLTGTRGEDTTTRDLVAIGDMLPKSDDATGAFYVLRSCSRCEHALEVASRGHGLFTLGMLDVLRHSQRNGAELLFNDALREAVCERMRLIASEVGITVRQTPESMGCGVAQVLIGARKAPPSILPPMAAVAPVVCPVCGRHNLVTETFKCRVCGSDHLCLSHSSGEPGICMSCRSAEPEIVVPVVPQAANDEFTVDFKVEDSDWRHREAEMLAALEAERLAAEKAERDAREAESAAAAKAEAERKEREIAEARARRKTLAKAKAEKEAAERAKREAELKAKLDAARKAREAAELRAREIREEARRKAGTAKTIILPGGVEMELVWCPPGEFMMGSPAGEEGRRADETQHRVRLTKGFWLGKYPVTQWQWQSVMGCNPSSFKGDDLPVETISWDDCQEFIKAVNAVLGCGARLPTEAEWEYACRAGTLTAYSWGDALNGDRVNCDGNYIGRKTTPVGSYGANRWGLYDMHGNVWEWCSDWYGGYPTDGVSDPQGPERGFLRLLNGDRVLRGGSWFDNTQCCRSARRDWCKPDHRSNVCGFRLCFSRSTEVKAPVPGTVLRGTEVKAPVPGTVLRVTAQSGQFVSKGDKILVMDVMMMETPVTAPCDGTVTVLVSAVDRVATGDVLAVIG